MTNEEAWATIAQELERARVALVGAAAAAKRDLQEEKLGDQFLDEAIQLKRWRDEAREQRRALEGIA